MRTLIYKRTHPGDPDVDGLFGIHDCMGQVRAWSFDEAASTLKLEVTKSADPCFLVMPRLKSFVATCL